MFILFKYCPSCFSYLIVNASDTPHNANETVGIVAIKGVTIIKTLGFFQCNLCNENPLQTMVMYSSNVSDDGWFKINTCVDIMTREILSSIYVATMEFIYWSVRSSSKMGGDGLKRVEGGGGYRYFSQLRVSLLSEIMKIWCKI